jgi:hypothetical protein
MRIDSTSNPLYEFYLPERSNMDMRFKKGELVSLIVISAEACATDKEKMQCQFTIDELAEELGATSEETAKWVRNLRNWGYIQTHFPPEECGNSLPNIYTVIMDGEIPIEVDRRFRKKNRKKASA